MNRFKNIILLALFFLFFVSWPAIAANKVNLYFFYGDGCPHCNKEEKFLDKLEQENANINIYRYEVWQDRDNAKFLSRLAKELNLDIPGVPILIVGDQTIAGYYNDQTTGQEIKAIVDDYVVNGCNDLVASVIGLDNINGQCVHDCDSDDVECRHNCGCSADNLNISSKLPDIINVPIFGSVEIKNFSLPILTVIIAAIDGFNPCAMWVLLFLISLLLGMEDKRRMWILGSSFIIASSITYFLFLSAWLNLFLFLGFVLWIRITVGLVALGSGGYHLWDAWRHRGGGCHITGSGKRKLIFTKLRQIASAKKFVLALGGIILLAIAVNLVELVCSAGLPAVYTQVLALSGLSVWQYYSYLLLYIFIFMLDDLLVFFIAMATLRLRSISSRYTRWSGLAGGLIMLAVGLLLLFKPGWLMFG